MGTVEHMLFFRHHATAVWFASNVGYVTRRAGLAGSENGWERC